MESDELLKFMREALKGLRDKVPRISDLMAQTLRLLADAGLFSLGPREEAYDAYTRLGQSHELMISLTQGYQQLMTLGYIIPMPEPPNAPNPSWFIITPKGRRWIEQTDPIPEDKTAYLATVKKLIPNLDPVISQYVQEALLTYGHNAIFASAVMIGAANEKAIYLLMSAFEKSVKDKAEKGRIRNCMTDRGLPALFKCLSENLERAKLGGLPYSVHEGADRHLLSIQEAIRVQRNEAVHPEAGKVTREAVHLTLSAFPNACKKIFDLIDWCAHNKF